MKSKKNDINIKRHNIIGKLDVIIFLEVVGIYLIALLSFFPGILTGDCVDQINQATNNAYYSAHPILHTFIIGNLTKLGGIWVPALFQIIIFAVIWTYLCKCIRKYNNSQLNKLMQVIFTFLICFSPLNFMYAITLWKDILYSYSILLLLVLIYVGIKEKFNYNTIQIALIAVSSVLIMKLRHNGLPIGLIMFALLFVLSMINNKSKVRFMKFIISFIVSIIVFSIPQVAVNKVEVPASGSILDSTKVYCMGALLNTDIELEEDEKEFLNNILDINVWKESYDAYTGSPILFNKDLKMSILSDKNNSEKFNSIFYKYAKLKKDTVINHFLSVNSIWWSVEELGGMHSVVLSNSWISEMSGGIYDNKPIVNRGNEILINYTNKTLGNKTIYQLFYRPATALLISIALILLVIIRQRKSGFKGYILLLLPMILNTGTYILLISSQDQRYFYPSFITEYVAIMIFIGCFFRKKDSINEKNKLEFNKKNPKTLVIIPAYNEEKSIKEVVNNVYKQDIQNCDVLVVNDGSNDNTYNEAKKTKAIVIDLPSNLGIGGAVQTGYIYAYQNNYDIAIQIDGDGQHDPRYIKEMINEIKKGNDMIIGSRFIEQTKYKQTFFRMLGINIISYIIKLMTNKKIYDTTSGYRAVNRNIIADFAKSYPYDYPEPCTNMSTLKNGYIIKEIPVEMQKRKNGVSSISQLKSVIYMLKVTIFLIIKGILD